ncbi:uncharacterized protein A4U43_UnF11190 [Asparagus officinalis]|uniref:Bromo domain-containing protein n=1 Tax=Asparagus officinalis TaxID=4686 RepID=A0A1R3L5B3_ASPOF|nr:ankyrin repeat, bromo and BTB domain-containing protein DDB_G0293800 [Asparagus officinalis]ONK54800.1 uncharacterized protein A4U43_UnF11190 [Asparagus officinalis]
MKRKRGSKKGHKKGKKNAPPVLNTASAPVSMDAEDSTCLDQNDDSQHDSGMDTEQPAIALDKPSNISSTETDQPNDNSTRKAGPGRLKVKLKSSRALEPQRSYSDVQTPSDTDKSNQQAALELNNKAMDKEDSAYSDGQTSRMQNNIFETVQKRAGSIKIKSSKSLHLSSEDVQDKTLGRMNSPTTQMQGERILVSTDDENEKNFSWPKNLLKLETKRHCRDPRYNEKELSAALSVIKKVMKMDAAEPFNAPVDPIALGIPDYFDIIDTPMDFGTICHRLEHGYKYMNSEDVFKDVQFIWENCYKYNNKGDYVVDLMKRVKKNFMKYWMAAGLFLDKPSNGATEKIHSEDGMRPTKDKVYSKGKHKHKRRKHGIDLHKSDCLCAVCVVRRRKRENNLAGIESQRKMSNANHPREFKIEGSSPENHVYCDDATSSQDHSQETDVNADVEEFENEEKMKTPEQADTSEALNHEAMEVERKTRLYPSGGREDSLHLESDNGDLEDSNKHSQDQELGSGFVNETGHQEDVAEIHRKDQDEETKHLENRLQQENHSILRISKSLFPSKVGSVWNGPHSLMQRHVASTRDSPIHAALAAFMKQ